MKQIGKGSFVLEGYTTAEEGYIKGAVKDPLDVRNGRGCFLGKSIGKTFENIPP